MILSFRPLATIINVAVDTSFADAILGKYGISDSGFLPPTLFFQLLQERMESEENGEENTTPTKEMMENQTVIQRLEITENHWFSSFSPRITVMNTHQSGTIGQKIAPHGHEFLQQLEERRNLTENFKWKQRKNQFLQFFSQLDQSLQVFLLEGSGENYHSLEEKMTQERWEFLREHLGTRLSLWQESPSVQPIEGEISFPEGETLPHEHIMLEEIRHKIKEKIQSEKEWLLSLFSETTSSFQNKGKIFHWFEENSQVLPLLAQKLKEHPSTSQSYSQWFSSEEEEEFQGEECITWFSFLEEQEWESVMDVTRLFLQEQTSPSTLSVLRSFSDLLHSSQKKQQEEFSHTLSTLLESENTRVEELDTLVELFQQTDILEGFFQKDESNENHHWIDSREIWENAITSTEWQELSHHISHILETSPRYQPFYTHHKEQLENILALPEPKPWFQFVKEHHELSTLWDSFHKEEKNQWFLSQFLHEMKSLQKITSLEEPVTAISSFHQWLTEEGREITGKLEQWLTLEHSLEETMDFPTPIQEIVTPFFYQTNEERETQGIKSTFLEMKTWLSSCKEWNNREKISSESVENQEIEHFWQETKAFLATLVPVYQGQERKQLSKLSKYMENLPLDQWRKSTEAWRNAFEERKNPFHIQREEENQGIVQLFSGKEQFFQESKFAFLKDIHTVEHRDLLPIMKSFMEHETCREMMTPWFEEDFPDVFENLFLKEQEQVQKTTDHRKEPTDDITDDIRETREKAKVTEELVTQWKEWISYLDQTQWHKVTEFLLTSVALGNHGEEGGADTLTGVNFTELQHFLGESRKSTPVGSEFLTQSLPPSLQWQEQFIKKMEKEPELGKKIRGLLQEETQWQSYFMEETFHQNQVTQAHWAEMKEYLFHYAQTAIKEDTVEEMAQTFLKIWKQSFLEEELLWNQIEKGKNQEEMLHRISQTLLEKLSTMELVENLTTVTNRETRRTLNTVENMEHLNTLEHLENRHTVEHLEALEHRNGLKHLETLEHLETSEKLKHLESQKNVALRDTLTKTQVQEQQASQRNQDAMPHRENRRKLEQLLALEQGETVDKGELVVENPLWKQVKRLLLEVSGDLREEEEFGKREEILAQSKVWQNSFKKRYQEDVTVREKIEKILKQEEKWTDYLQENRETEWLQSLTQEDWTDMTKSLWHITQENVTKGEWYHMTEFLGKSWSRGAELPLMEDFLEKSTLTEKISFYGEQFLSLYQQESRTQHRRLEENTLLRDTEEVELFQRSLSTVEKSIQESAVLSSPLVSQSVPQVVEKTIHQIEEFLHKSLEIDGKSTYQPLKHLESPPILGQQRRVQGEEPPMSLLNFVEEEHFIYQGASLVTAPPQEPKISQSIQDTMSQTRVELLQEIALVSSRVSSTEQAQVRWSQSDLQEINQTLRKQQEQLTQIQETQMGLLYRKDMSTIAKMVTKFQDAEERLSHMRKGGQTWH